MTVGFPAFLLKGLIILVGELKQTFFQGANQSLVKESLTSFTDFGLTGTISQWDIS